MKVLVLADSRGYWPEGYTWHHAFNQKTNLKHEIHSYITCRDAYLISIYMMETYVLKHFPEDKSIDLLLIHTGWHEGGPCFWPEDVWKNMAEQRWNPKALVNEITHKGKIQYQYIDKENEQAALQTMLKKTKHCLLIGLPSIRPPNDLDTEYHMGMRHHYDTLRSNEKFSSMGTDFLNLPMDSYFPTYYCSKDRIHFNPRGSDYVADYLVRYSNRFDKTLSSCLADSLNHQRLFNKAKLHGTAISFLTQKGDVVLISGETSEELMSQFLGCVLYGRKPLIIQHPSGKISPKEFDYKMQDIAKKTNASLCISAASYQKDYERFFKTISGYSLPEIPSPIEVCLPKDVAFLQLSSGTTGDVKVIEVTHKHLIENCEEYAIVAGLDSHSVVASWLPLYHDMGLIATFLLPIILDCKSFIMDTFEWLANPISFLKLMSGVGATHCWMPNFAFSYLAKVASSQKEELCNLNLSSVKSFISCSEPTYLKDLMNFVTAFKECGVTLGQIKNCYALAENIFAVSQANEIRITELNNITYVSCGLPICNNSVLIRDNEEDITETGKIGNVMVKSSTQPQTNKPSNFYGYYDTGDLGFMREGEIFIVGREKDAFVSFGNNIYPNLLESSLDKIENIIDGRVACFGVLDSNIGSHLVYIVAETDVKDEKTDLRELIQKRVKNLFDVQCIIYIEREGFIVKTSSGKISRNRTAEKVLTRDEILTAVNKFLNSKNKSSVSLHDSIYSSGLLDSLDAFELILHLEKEGFVLDRKEITGENMKLKLSDLDTVSDLSQKLQKRLT